MVKIAEVEVEAEIFPKILYRLKDNDILVNKFAGIWIREIAKQISDLAKMICNADGTVVNVAYIT